MIKSMLTMTAIVAACAVAACAPARSQPEAASDLSLMQKRLAASEEKMEALSQQVALLQVMVDGHQRTLQGLGNADAGQAEAPPLPSAPQAEPVSTPAIEEIPEVKDTATPARETRPAPPQPEPSSSLHEETSPQAPAAEDLPATDAANPRYQQAMDIFQNGDFESAAPLFEAFAADFPGDDLADNALYWAGECKYTRKKFTEAIQRFKRVVEEYPNGSKVPDALLKIGFAYISLGDNESAVPYLKQVVAQYPFSSAGTKAEARLKAINR